MISDERIFEVAVEGGIYDCLTDPYDRDKSGDNYSSVKHDLIRFARALLKEAGLTGAGASVVEEPEGWQLVPVIPTDAMALAAIKVGLRNPAINGVAAYRAMLTAAPKYDDKK